MAWFESKQDWYRYWDGPEMIEFRRRNTGQYTIPITYVWYDELVVGALGPEVEAERRARAGARRRRRRAPWPERSDNRRGGGERSYAWR